MGEGGWEMGRKGGEEEVRLFETNIGIDVASRVTGQ